MRRRRQSQREGVEPNTRLGSNEKENMRERVSKLVGRPIGILQCPISFARFAEVYNATQDQTLMAAAHTLESVPAGSRAVNRLRSADVQIPLPEWQDATLRMRMRTPEDEGHYRGSDESPLLMIHGEPSWPAIANRLAPEELRAMTEWFGVCVQINASVQETLQTFSQVLKLVNTAGQLNRLVPECVLFMSPDKRAKLAEQAKASAMPEGYFQLDHPAVARMNEFLTKCRLMPEQSWDIHGYSNFSWVA